MTTMGKSAFERAALSVLGWAIAFGVVLAMPDPAQAAQQKRPVAVEVKKRQQLAPKPGKKKPRAAPRRKATAAPAASSRPTSMPVASMRAVAATAQPLGHHVEDPGRLHSNAVLVLDQDTNAVLLGKNDDAVLPIASLTKLMTGLVITDAGLPMDEVLTITEDDIDRLKGSGSRLAVGTRLTRGEALHLALMASENRAAHALGRTYPGGIDAFVAAMNQKAAQLGMSNTRFVEPTGLSSENRSSPRDLARLVAVASERPLLREFTTSPQVELATGQRVIHYRNSNKLVRESDWEILLQKTGYIREAGRCVVMQVRLAGRKLIMVLMDAANSSARWNDAERLLRWLQHGVFQGQASVHSQAAPVGELTGQGGPVRRGAAGAV